MTFVDSGAWFALYIPVDPNQRDAVDWISANPGQLLTTDYVIDETLTLLRARGQRAIALDFGNDIFSGRLAAVHYLTPEEIAESWKVFERFIDKDWSFTECASKVVIERLGIGTAFAFDQHFRQFGNTVVVP